MDKNIDILGNIVNFLLVALIFLGVLAITFKITLKNYNANEQVINQDIPNLENYNNNLMLKFNVSNNNKNNYFNDYIQKDTNVKYFNESYIYNISNY